MANGLGPIAAEVGNFDDLKQVPKDIFDAIARINARASWETRSNELTYSASASVAEKPSRIRSFEDTPRERAEIGGGISYIGDRFAVALQGQAVDSPADGEDYRADGSMVGIVAGNWTVSANTMNRWWGPGWDGSLILSDNARQIPSLSIDRIFTDAFTSKWLAWLGPWDLAVHFGEMESDRAVPNTRFFGMRFAYRPTRSLEIGISRTAQWCGNDRPCDFDTFVDLFAGRDNIYLCATTRMCFCRSAMTLIEPNFFLKDLSPPDLFLTSIISVPPSLRLPPTRHDYANNIASLARTRKVVNFVGIGQPEYSASTQAADCRCDSRKDAAK